MNPISHGHTVIKVTEEYTLRPQKNDRCDVLIAAYEYLLNNFAYAQQSYDVYDDDDCGYSGTYVDAEDIKDLIAQLKGIKDE